MCDIKYISNILLLCNDYSIIIIIIIINLLLLLMINDYCVFREMINEIMCVY